mmetsp:Transcript_23155/g.64385  ORF Transcript_23155/g.64385 Transcript_23155/m.64385 type:complete len:429 (+) Transcript_23155:970-2256(+)
MPFLVPDDDDDEQSDSDDLLMEMIEEDERMVVTALSSMWLSFSNTILVLVHFCFKAIFRQACPSIQQPRLDWEDFCHFQRADFHRHMRMTREDFNLLLDLTMEPLSTEMVRTDGHIPIPPVIKLYCAIRWLAGGSYLDIKANAGVSKTSFYRAVWEAINAINGCKELELKFPQTEDECFECAKDFCNISYGDAIINCVSVADGYAVEIETPPGHVVGNVRSFFSGHKQKNCVNVQACCDAFCRFQYVAVAGPGSLNDRDALVACDLGRLVDNLPLNYVMIFDAAYPSSKHGVPMYFGVDKENPFCDNFNYYASQLRIRIEMAFGMMYQKWGVLWRPMRVSIDNVKCVVQAIARLHTFVINQRLKREGYQDFSQRIQGTERFQPPDDNREQREYNESIENMVLGPTGISFIRTRMAERVQELGLTRPPK